MQLINVNDLDFSYNNENKTIQIFEQLNFSVNNGEFVAVLGHNGSGKSTLAKHFNSILLPCGGKVFVDGLDSSVEENIYTIRQKLGMVFQNPDNQIVATIVEEDVAFALENLGVPSEEIRRRVDEALKTVGMYDFRLHSPHQLSGGQKQRVAIAGIIAMRPKCIVLDEPTAMLDPMGRKEVIKTLKKLNQDGTTIVLITHYMDEAVEAGRVVVMEQGKIIIDNTPKNVFSKVTTLKKLGLDVPQVTELAYELKKEGINIDPSILTVDELVCEISKLLEEK